MQLSDAQVSRFRRDGFLLFPGLFSKAEIAVLRAETARLASIEADSVIRERTGGVRSIFRVHEDDGATRSAAFRALVRTPRVLAPTRQALGTDEVYVYHTKINTKPAIEGTVWMWHQDYGSCQPARCQRRGPLAHLHLVQCLRQRTAVRAEFASRLGRIAQHQAAAARRRRRRTESRLKTKRAAFGPKTWSVPVLGACVQRDGNLDVLAVAPNGQLDGVADLVLVQAAEQARYAVHRLAVDGGADVPRDDFGH